MNYKLKGRDILYNEEQMGPYPDHLFPRRDTLTVEVSGPVRNYSQSENASSRVSAGEFGETMAKEKARIIDKSPYGAALFQIRTNVKYINNERKNPVAPEKAELPDDIHAVTRHLKGFGFFLGADQMAVCKVPEGCAYTDDEFGNPIDISDTPYALIFLKRKHWETCAASDGHDWIFDACSHQVYQQLAGWTDTVANYIRRLGWKAEVSNMRNYSTLMTPLILHSGLGEPSRMGIALNPFFGANFKVAAVLTDLPLECDRPIDFGLQEYCRNCTICADACPCGAISRQTEYTMYHGYQSWGMDFIKCAKNNAINPFGSVCGRCTIMCPWNRPVSPEDFKDWDGNLEYIYKQVNDRAEYITSRGLMDDDEHTKKWWFDLEDKGDGILKIPATTPYETVE